MEPNDPQRAQPEPASQDAPVFAQESRQLTFPEQERQEIMRNQAALVEERDRVFFYSEDQDRWEAYDRVEMERVYRPPALVTLVFVLTMLAIYFMGRTVQDVYPALGA